MSIISSDGPASLSNPIGTNPSKFSSAGYENPWVPIEANNNTRLLTRTQQKTNNKKDRKTKTTKNTTNTTK